MTQPSHASATPVQTARPRRGSCAAVLAILLLWLLIIALAAGAVVGLAQIYTGDRILAGTQALGRDLGGMTPAEAAALLQADWQAHNIVLDAGEQSWTLAPDQIGAVLDAEATAARAYQPGESRTCNGDRRAAGSTSARHGRPADNRRGAFICRTGLAFRPRGNCEYAAHARRPT